MAFDTSQYVLYLEDWQVLICLDENCRYCLISNGIQRHFQRYHANIYDLSFRKQIGRYANTLTLCRPCDIMIPTNTPLSIPGLKIWNGWQCTECFKVDPMMDDRKQHCENNHDWKSSQGKNS